MYTLLTPIRYVLDPRFNLTTPLQAGLFYLAPGCGYFIGTIVGGRYSDIIVRRWILKRNGNRIPEDRLRAGLIPFATLLPGTVLVYGWCVEKGKGGIPVPVISMFLNAFGQFLVFPSVNTYCTGLSLAGLSLTEVEVMPLRSAESSGSKYFMQFIFAGAASASCLPLIQAIGVGWASTICTTPVNSLIMISGFHSDGRCVNGVSGHFIWGKNARMDPRRDCRKREADVLMLWHKRGLMILKVMLERLMRHCQRS